MYYASIAIFRKQLKNIWTKLIEAVYQVEFLQIKVKAEWITFGYSVIDAIVLKMIMKQ